ncbi:MAG: hypothetical protein M0R03_10995 [Novosphingobium sp.]|nr:hypothetical protein [Novosphingobium sp.]
MKFLWQQIEEKKTIGEWEAETGIVILDPDGFDRSDGKLYDRLMTRLEFIKGCVPSTVKGLNILNDIIKNENIEFYGGMYVIKTKQMELKN